MLAHVGRTIGSLTLALSAGCAMPAASPVLEPPPVPWTRQSTDDPKSKVVPASAIEPAEPATKNDSPFVGRDELLEAELIAQVLARNPTIAQMSAAAQMAAARPAQVSAHDDPRLGGFFGPASIHSRNVDFAYRVEASQAIPFPGKLALRGEGARHEATAANLDLDDARLALTEAALGAFADYFLAARSAEVNAEGLKLLAESRENAAARYRAGQGEQQDVFQADVAIARQRERALALERMQRIARARLNTLMHRPADAELPKPAKSLDVGGSLPPVTELRNLATRQRPDLAALSARVAAAESAVALARKEYYPDFEAMASYDAFWQRPEQDLRPMVGLRLNVPIRSERRSAAVAESQARLAQRRAEFAKAVDQAGLQIQEAFEQVRETDQALKLYEENAVPAARESVRLAQAAYTTGKVPMLTLIEAQRSLVELRDRQFELRAESRRRRAALDRATGSHIAPAVSPKTETPPVAGPSPETLPTVVLEVPRTKHTGWDMRSR